MNYIDIALAFDSMNLIEIALALDSMNSIDIALVLDWFISGLAPRSLMNWLSNYIPLVINCPLDVNQHSIGNKLSIGSRLVLNW